MLCHDLGTSSKSEELHLAWKELHWSCGCLGGCYQSKIVTFMKMHREFYYSRNWNIQLLLCPNSLLSPSAKKVGPNMVNSTKWLLELKVETSSFLSVSVILPELEACDSRSLGRWCCCSGRMAYSKSNQNIILVDINSLVATLIKSLNERETLLLSSRCLHVCIQVVLTL